MADHGGGCCIARYGGVAYDMSKVHRIMLRFRPIAPKPADGSGAQKAGDFGHGGSERRKRGNTKRCNNKKRKISSKEKENKNGEVVTLPLLPLTPQETGMTRNKDQDFATSPEKVSGVGVFPPIPNPPVAAAAAFRTWVIKCMTETWVSPDMLERRVDLAKDSSPGFVSEGLSRVLWTNTAFREMAGEGEVAVAVKERVAAAAVMRCWAFSCRVRVCGEEKKWRSVTVPCDVWRIGGDNGGATFAWRLDVDAALSLGR